MYDALVMDALPPVVKNVVEPDDATLIRRSSQQDVKAFEQLYRKFFPRVYNFIFRLLGNRELSEEAAADTLYAVWKSAASFQGRSTVSTWILGIAYRTALKALDKNARHTKKRSNPEILDDITDTHPGHDPAQVTGTMIDTNRVQRALTKLSTDCSTNRCWSFLRRDSHHS